MRAADRMYFEKYAVDPDSEGFVFEMSAEGWGNDSDEKEMEPAGWLDEAWSETE